MNRKKVTYITDLEARRGGGGSYAVNWNIQNQLKRRYELDTPAPIVPKVPVRKRLLSRINRSVLKRCSKFYYFSPTLLDQSAAKAHSFFDGSGSDAIFFRSAARWCHCRPKVPYFVYLDVVFHTFFENTFNRNEFCERDLFRIYETESAFLKGASAVFFESNWGLDRAKDNYSLEGDHYFVVNRGGVIEPPEKDARSTGTPMLVSVAMNFEQKGGDITLEVFTRLKQRYPELRWHIIGGEPTGDWRLVDGIVYEGVLNLDNEEDLRRYRKLLSQAFLLIHPTREDTNPLVITEAQYFGCPCISVRRFAIPELILNAQTGYLVDTPVDPSELERAIERLLKDQGTYNRMRKDAFNVSRTRFSWDKVGDDVSSHMDEVLC